MKKLAILAVLAIALLLAGATSAAQPRNDVKNYQHVFVIMMENTGYDSLVGNPNAPWINSAIAKYGVATSYFGVYHPSQPNYIVRRSTFSTSPSTTQIAEEEGWQRWHISRPPWVSSRST